MASRADQTSPRARGTNPRAVAAAESALPPGYLKCFNCGTPFNPHDSKITGVRVAPSAHCNPCQQSCFDAGRWQERLRLEAAA